MGYNSNIHHRKSIRLEGYDYSKSGAYFITICTWNRENIFGEVINSRMNLNSFGDIVEMVWKQLPNRFSHIQYDKYVIMPNHFHGILVIREPEEVIHELSIQNQKELPNVGAIHELPLQNQKERRRMLIPKIIGYFKMNTAKQINQLRDTEGIPVWQRNYYERIIRDENELNVIQQYIMNNPLNWLEDNENLMIRR